MKIHRLEVGRRAREIRVWYGGGSVLVAQLVLTPGRSCAARSCQAGPTGGEEVESRRNADRSSADRCQAERENLVSRGLSGRINLCSWLSILTHGAAKAVCMDPSFSRKLLLPAQPKSVCGSSQ